MKPLRGVFHDYPLRSMAGVIALLLLGLGLYNLIASGSDPAVDAIRRQGYPVTLAELNAWYPAVPANNNAALVYMRAFASAVTTRQFSAKLPEKTSVPPRGAPWGSEETRQLQLIVQESAGELAEMYALRDAAPSRYPIDLNNGLWTMLPHLAKVKEGTTVLSGLAILKASEGCPEEAVHALLAAGRLADSVSREPLLISQLVRYSSWGIWATRLERLVNLAALSSAQLEELQNMAGRAEAPDSLARGLIGEQAIGLAGFSDPAQRSAMLGMPPGVSGTTMNDLRVSLLAAGLKTTGILKRDRSFYLSAMDKMIRSAQLDYPSRWNTGSVEASAAVIVTNRFLIFSGRLLPALGRTFLRDADHTAKMRIVRAALAVERYRRANSEQLPPALERLVPNFLEAVPTDPYDGNPVRYRHENRGFIVYSIGSDGGDQGGTETPPGKGAPVDITFIVER